MGARNAPVYRVISLGCKVNRVESDAFEHALEQRGYRMGASAEAQIVIVNTCTVTGEAEKKTRKAVRRALRDSPDAIVYVTGCAAAIDADTYLAMDGRVRTVPKSALIERISGQNPSHGRTRDSHGNGRVRVGVKIQDGCDNACTYCVVHTARGPASSRDSDEVVDECRRLVAEGVPEIILAGINLGAYLHEGVCLSMLLARLVEEVPLRGASRIRLSSIEPQDVTEDLARCIASSEGLICRHLHLPLQSGSSRVLGQMARRYDRRDFEAKISLLHALMPDVSLTTDVIVGFPGETEEDFRETLDLCRTCSFSKIHVFPYSPRRGTPAADRLDQIPPSVKEERALRLRTLSDELRHHDLSRRIGRTECVVVESKGKARTESYHEVAVPEELLVGSLVPVTLTPQMLEYRP